MWQGWQDLLCRFNNHRPTRLLSVGRAYLDDRRRKSRRVLSGFFVVRQCLGCLKTEEIWVRHNDPFLLDAMRKQLPRINKREERICR
jgi:hypothetical protein